MPFFREQQNPSLCATILVGFFRKRFANLTADQRFEATRNQINTLFV